MPVGSSGILQTSCTTSHKSKAKVGHGGYTCTSSHPEIKTSLDHITRCYLQTKWREQTGKTRPVTHGKGRPSGPATPCSKPPVSSVGRKRSPQGRGRVFKRFLPSTRINFAGKKKEGTLSRMASILRHPPPCVDPHAGHGAGGHKVQNFLPLPCLLTPHTSVSDACHGDSRDDSLPCYTCSTLICVS